MAEVDRSGSAAWRRSGARPNARRKNRQGWLGSERRQLRKHISLAAGNPPPDWADFAPVDPKGLARIFGGNSRHAREVAEAQVRFDIAVKAHAQAEAARQRALAKAKAAYDLQVAADQKRVADVRGRQSAFISGDPEAVEWFVSRVLDASRYPAVSRVDTRSPTGRRTGMSSWSSSCRRRRSCQSCAATATSRRVTR